MNTDERLLKLLQAPLEVQAEIDRVLDSGTVAKADSTSSGPLLLGMGAGARFLGVSRATLWRMIQKGVLAKVEVLPGSFRVRRADLETIANGRKPEGQ
jgi:hypothetical protein